MTAEPARARVHTVVDSPRPADLVAADGALVASTRKTSGTGCPGPSASPTPHRSPRSSPSDGVLLRSTHRLRPSAGLTGTPFQTTVWRALLRSPTDRGLLRRTRGPDRQTLGVRAVGLANGRNPISIIVPAPVVGSSGSLTGYGGGLARKQWLLALEQRRAHQPPLLDFADGLDAGEPRSATLPMGSHHSA